VARFALPFRPDEGLAQVQEPGAAAVKREAEEDWGQGAVAVITAGALYAVAVRDGGDLLMLVTIRRSRQNVYVNIPRPHLPDWQPHASYHASGQRHQVSFGCKFDVQAHPCPDEFRGQQNVVTLLISPTETRAVNLACNPADFHQTFEIAKADIAPKGARLAIDLVEPGLGPLTPCPDATLVRESAFADSEPWIVVSLWSLQ
jgi:hypothetical protein